MDEMGRAVLIKEGMTEGKRHVQSKHKVKGPIVPMLQESPANRGVPPHGI